VLANPAPNVLLVNFGSDALEFEIRAFLRDVNWMMSVKSDINHAIVERFAAENIEVPFPQRDVWLRTRAGEKTSKPDGEDS
jgi:potassium efflux system protein